MLVIYRFICLCLMFVQVMALGITGENDCVVAGCLDGTFSVRRRQKGRNDNGAFGVGTRETNGGGLFGLGEDEGNIAFDFSGGSSGAGSTISGVSRRRKYFMRGTTHTAAADDYSVVHKGKKQHLKAYDK